MSSRQQVGRPLGKFVARQPTEIAGVAQLVSDLVECLGNPPASDKLAAALTPQLRFARNRPVGQVHLFIARVAGPLEDILEQVAMDGFQVLGIELQRRAFSCLDLDPPGGDILRFALFKLVMRGRAELVFEGIRAAVGVAGHDLSRAAQRL